MSSLIIKQTILISYFSKFKTVFFRNLSCHPLNTTSSVGTFTYSVTNITYVSMKQQFLFRDLVLLQHSVASKNNQRLNSLLLVHFIMPSIQNVQFFPYSRIIVLILISFSSFAKEKIFPGQVSLFSGSSTIEIVAALNLKEVEQLDQILETKKARMDV